MSYSELTQLFGCITVLCPCALLMLLGVSLLVGRPLSELVVGRWLKAMVSLSLISALAVLGIMLATGSRRLLNQRVTKINCKEYNSQEYLLYLLRSELVLKQIYSHPGGTKQANLSIKQLCGITVKVPPLLEQCRIAEILGVWDESIDLLERLILEFRLRKKVKGSQG